MDRLKDAAEHLEAPDCPNCRIAMRWFRSELVRDSGVSMIAHLFICPNCKRARRIDTKSTRFASHPTNRPLVAFAS